MRGRGEVRGVGAYIERVHGATLTGLGSVADSALIRHVNEASVPRRI